MCDDCTDKAWEAAYAAEEALDEIRDWLNDNDHRLPDGGDALWKILNGEHDA